MSDRTDIDATPLTDALRVLQRRWRLVLVCLVLVTGSALGLSLLQQQKYTASAQLLFTQTNFDQQLFGTAFVQPTVDPTQEAATNQKLVGLPIVAQRTASVLGLSSGYVSSEVSVSPVGQANLVQVSATDPSPVLAARIANTYANQYVVFRRQADRNKIAGAQQLVQQELARLTPAQKSSPQGISLSNRAQQLQVLASLQTGNAELVQPAPVPSSPSVPKTTRNGILGVVIGLLLGLGLAFLSERLDRKIRDPEALEETFGVPVLGVIMESSAYATSPTIAALPHIESEAFALLRARLRYFNVDREVRSLLISSAAPQDGKSTVALNLAAAEAQVADKKVVLLEADLRRPTLAQRLGIPRSPGLAELLSGNVELSSVTQSVTVHGPAGGAGREVELAVIPAGEVPPNPAELVESRAMIELLGTLVDQYDFVMIDSPPAHAVSDAMHLMRLADGVIVVSRVGKNTRDMARYLRQQLEKLNVPVLGIVANGVPAGQRSYASYGYYGAYAYASVAAANGAEAEGSVGDESAEEIDLSLR